MCDIDFEKFEKLYKAIQAIKDNMPDLHPTCKDKDCLECKESNCSKYQILKGVLE